MTPPNYLNMRLRLILLLRKVHVESSVHWSRLFLISYQNLIRCRMSSSYRVDSGLTSFRILFLKPATTLRNNLKPLKVQLVSEFVQSVHGLIIAGKHVVLAKVRHSQKMNDPTVLLWIITENDGRILSANCSGCMAGQGETCSHIASVLFYIETFNRIRGKLACTDKQCEWILPRTDVL